MIRHGLRQLTYPGPSKALHVNACTLNCPRGPDASIDLSGMHIMTARHFISLGGPMGASGCANAEGTRRPLLGDIEWT